MNYFKQVAVVFGAAWNGRSYSIKSATAPRAFIRVSPDVVRRLDQDHAERSDFVQLAESLHRGAPHRRPALRDRGRVETQRMTVDSLARELKLALEYPEGAGV